MAIFVFTKPGVEAGESLADIVARKEAERIAGQNTFWWGVGTSLGESLQRPRRMLAELFQLFFCLTKNQHHLNRMMQTLSVS